MGMQVVETHSAPLERDGVKCWTFVTKLDQAIHLEPGDELTFKLNNVAVVRLHVEKKANIQAGFLRITACGDIILQGPKIDDIHISGEVAPPLNCMVCMDTLSDMGLASYVAWRSFMPNLINLNIKV